jgi:hypothetical protein
LGGGLEKLNRSAGYYRIGGICHNAGESGALGAGSGYGQNKDNENEEIPRGLLEWITAIRHKVSPDRLVMRCD